MQNLATIYQALADIHRIKIFAALILNTELTELQISAFLKISPIEVSCHLQILQDANLLKFTDKDRQQWFRLNKDIQDFEPITAMIKHRMDNDLEFQAELNKIDEILESTS